MTFSIVARCTTTGAIGAATATAGPAVGALVLHGASLAGAIAGFESQWNENVR